MTNQKQLQVAEPWLKEKKNVLDEFNVKPDQGLTPETVEKRRQQYGPNRLRIHKAKSAWAILLEQFKSIIVGLLVVSAILSILFGGYVEGVAIIAVVLINAAIGFFTELRAVRSMEALREMSSMDSKVIRNGESQQIAAEKIVLGDIVILNGGDIVTADMRLVKASKLQANESALTGESEPVSKQVTVLEGEIPLSKRTNMLFKGTAVTRGSGLGVVTATGMDTELGKISSLVAEAEEEHTPLEDRLDKLGQRLVWVTLGIIVVVALVGILRGKDILLMIETAVALAVAAVPEGLPIVATIALARGMTRMAQQNALINRLASVETLGSSTVVCTDKTGTLTENQMTVSQIVLESGEVQVSGEGMQTQGRFYLNGNQIEPEQNQPLMALLKAGTLCNNASVKIRDGQDAEAVGEPLEIALLVAGIKAGIEREQLTQEQPEAKEVAFDPEIKMMATFHEHNDHYRLAVKGSPEAVLEKCKRRLTEDGPQEMIDEDRNGWLDKNTQLAKEGYRMLALATKQTDVLENPYEELTFLGLVAMQDPPREEVSDAINDFKGAGVQVVMVTGDQPLTAKSIGQAVELVGEDAETILGQELGKIKELDKDERRRFAQASIFARVSPKQKLDLISLYQEQGEVVAMTGDGVNDAPALKKADIGIAMGQRGTQVAREAADMVLEDDAFSTIVLAIRLGRVIFNNIRRFVLYLISCNVSEIMVVFFASLINWPLPIRPLQILFLNLVTDVFPALALGVSKGDASVMRHKPRDKSEAVLTRSHWFAISGYSVMITLSVFGAFALAGFWMGMSTSRTVTISFLTLALAQLWHVFNMRDSGSRFFKNDIVRSPYVWGALFLCLGLLIIAIYVPFLANLLKLEALGFLGWGLAIGFSIIPLIIGQFLKQVRIQEATS
jgi:Ca2+-transporting ATPase